MCPFQTVYQIELLFPLKLDYDKDQDTDRQPTFIVLCKLDCDPCIPIGAEIDVPKWSLGHKEGFRYNEKEYNFNAKVVGIKREIHHPSSSDSKGTFLVRYFVEAEDRDLVIEMCERIKNNNL